MCDAAIAETHLIAPPTELRLSRGPSGSQKRENIMKIKQIAVGVALAIVAANATTPAQAGSNLCPTARVCIYVHENFVGLLGYRSAGGGLLNLSTGAQNEMSSWENKTSTDASWFTGLGGNGTCRTMLKNSEKSLVVIDYNDLMKSWRTDQGC